MTFQITLQPVVGFDENKRSVSPAVEVILPRGPGKTLLQSQDSKPKPGLSIPKPAFNASAFSLSLNPNYYLKKDSQHVRRQFYL